MICYKVREQSFTDAPSGALNQYADRHLFRKLGTSHENDEEEMNILGMPFHK
jgi:hypothetical protein